MSKVLFSKKIDKILKKVDFTKLGEKVALKVHFGEKGCITYTPPKIIKKVYDKIINNGGTAELVDCNVLYRGSRTNTKEHVSSAKKHGFDFAPISILDGEYGQDYVEVNSSKLGKKIKDYDSLVVLTHFKGHASTGFGGAIKNVGMGLGSRAGKLYMHSDVNPYINQSRCVACGDCVKNCPVNAIRINEKAEIDKDKCIGCAMCIAVCPVKVVKIPWSGSTNKELQEKICDYTKAVLSLFESPIFINCLINITKNCDCMSHAQEPVIEDIGFLYSKDIISVDSASKDMIDEKNVLKDRSKKFKHMLEYGEKIGLGEQEYEMGSAGVEPATSAV